MIDDSCEYDFQFLDDFSIDAKYYSIRRRLLDSGAKINSAGSVFDGRMRIIPVIIG